MSSPEIADDQNSLPQHRQNALRSNPSLVSLVRLCGNWLTHLDDVQADEAERTAGETEVKEVIKSKIEAMLRNPAKATKFIDDIADFALETAKESHELAAEATEASDA